jgi:hypothetical protein
MVKHLLDSLRQGGPPTQPEYCLVYDGNGAMPLSYTPSSRVQMLMHAVQAHCSITVGGKWSCSRTRHATVVPNGLLG